MIVKRCECGHPKEAHNNAFGLCSKLGTAGFPCKCTKYIPNKDDRIQLLEEVIDWACKQSGMRPLGKWNNFVDDLRRKTRRENDNN